MERGEVRKEEREEIRVCVTCVHSRRDRLGRSLPPPNAPYMKTAAGGRTALHRPPNHTFKVLGHFRYFDW